MTGELTASYINNNLDLVGTVEISRGEADILTRRFAVESGSEVRFIGGDYANPFLDIQARYVTQQYGDVVLNISNTAAAPKFGYSSENAEQDYDQSDLFAILLLGRPASALADSEGESSMNALSLALSTVTGSVSSALGGTVVDEVDWDPESGVRIGKSISEKLFLVYDRNSNPDDTENINQVTLEWLISRRLYAEFRTGDRAQSAANIYWRRIFGEAGTEVHNPHLMPGSRDEEAPPPEEDAQN
jgi:autotransporter translocation and assembly factor TamB